MMVALHLSNQQVDWINAMLPSYNEKKINLTPHQLSIDTMCKWSNEKALLMNMGTPDLYPTVKLFTVQELEQYLYVFFWNGLNPSPQIEWRILPEETGSIHHRSFLRKFLGPNPTLRLYHWNSCFACQDPKLAISSRKSHPNHKIDE